MFNFFKIITKELFDTNTLNENIKKSFETNTKVNKSMMVNSLNNIINKVINDVAQNNVVIASGLASSVNTLNIIGVKTKNITLSNITQNTQTDTVFDITTAQSNISLITTNITTNISKQITNNSNISDILDKINSQNTKDLKNILNSYPPIPNFPKPPSLLSSLFGNILGPPDKNTNVINIDAETNIKKLLDIDDSFNINDTNNISNDINNMITQTNFASCNGVAIAQNNITLMDIDADNILINYINQDAQAKLNLKCVFSQSNTSTISNKIINQISTKINRLYDNTNPKNYQLLDALGGVVSDYVIGLNETIGENNPMTEKSIESENNKPITDKLNESENNKPITEKSNESEKIKSINQKLNESEKIKLINQKSNEITENTKSITEKLNTFLNIYFIIIIIVIIIILIILFLPI